MSNIQSLFLFGARYRLATILVLVILTGLTVTGLPKVRVDASQNALTDPDDPAKPIYEEIIDVFGSDYMALVYLRDPDLFTPEKLAIAEGLHYALDQLAFVERVESLFSAANVRNVDGDLDTTPLMDTVPETQDEIDKVLDSARRNPFVIDNLMDRSGNVMSISVRIAPNWDDEDLDARVFDQIEILLAPLRNDFAEVFQIGPPRTVVTSTRGVVRDMSVLAPTAAILVMAGILIFLRSTGSAILPMLTSGFSIVWTLGAAGHLGIPVSVISGSLPLLLVAVGSTEDTHMVSAYLRGLGNAPGEPFERRRLAVAFMMRKVGVATMVTAGTTAIGFGASAISPIPIVVDFALLTSMGMIFNLVATMLCVPMLLQTFGPKSTHTVQQDESPTGIFRKFYQLSISAAENHWRTTIGFMSVIAVVGLVFGMTLKPNNDPLSYLKDGNPIITDTQTMHRDLAGVQVFYVVLDGRKSGFFTSPENLQNVATIQHALLEEGRFDNVLSLADHISYVNREMTTGQQDQYRVPDDRALIEQYLLFFQQSALKSFVDINHRRVALPVRHNIFNSADIEEAIKFVESTIEQVAGPDLRYEVVSQNLLVNRASAVLVKNQIFSFALVVLVIFVLISIMYASIPLGLVSLVPNLLPALVVFGVMAIFDMPLNPGTVLVAVVALGIAVDDTIHLLTSYSRTSRLQRDTRLAARMAVSTQVVAVTTTSITLGLSFLVFLFSEFSVVSQFGLLCAVGLITAVVADLTLTPIFLRFVRLVGIWDIIALDVGVKPLMNSPLFQGMTAFQVRKIILLCEVLEYQDGFPVIDQGQSDSSLYVLLDGAARVLRRDHHGVDHLLSTLTAGEVFGEVGFAGAAKRTASVLVTGRTKVLKINADDTRQSLRLYPHVAAKLYRNISVILGRHLNSTFEAYETDTLQDRAS